MLTHHDVTCVLCKQGATGHDRVNGECFLYRRAEVRPYRLALRKVPAAAASGVIR